MLHDVDQWVPCTVCQGLANGKEEPQQEALEANGATGEVKEDEEDDDAEDEVEPAIDDDEDEGAEVLQTHTAAQTEQFNEDLKNRLKQGLDRFDEMVQHEEQIRLGETGWKERYYKVCISTSCCMAGSCVPLK